MKILLLLTNSVSTFTMPPFAIAREPGRKFGTIVTLVLAYVLAWLVQGATPVIFPPMARAKGLTIAQYSCIFGFFGLCRLIVLFFDNELLSLARPKFYVVNGLFLISGTNLLIGALYWSPGGGIFFLLSLLLYILGGIGFAFLNNASLLVMDLAFPTHSLYYVALLESFSMAGLLAGPPIFSFLALFGNFSVPFIFFGTLLLITSFVAYLTLVDERPAFEWSSPSDTQDLCRISLARSAQVLSFVNASAEAFLLVSLTGHAKQLNLGAEIGYGTLYFLLYLSYGAAYFFVKVLTTHTYERKAFCKKGELLWSMFGCLASASGFLLFGPASFMGTSPSDGLMGSSLVLQGLGSGCLASSAFATLLRIARTRLRLPYDNQTYAFIAKMTSLPAWAGYACGAFASCTLSPKSTSMGVACTVFVAIFLLMATCCLASYLCQCRKASSLSSEATPICDCSLHMETRSTFPASPTDLMPSDEDWQWLIQKREEDFLQPSL